MARTRFVRSLNKNNNRDNNDSGPAIETDRAEPSRASTAGFEAFGIGQKTMDELALLDIARLSRAPLSERP